MVPNLEPKCFSSACPSRVLFDQIADKWSMMTLTVLEDGPLRFNEIKRQLEGISQKALTQCLRRLQRNGLISRQVISFSPVAVQYQVTPLGRTLQKPMQELYAWTLDKLQEIENARRTFDQTSSQSIP
ncbi:MarR family transcriptional regulator [Thalassospira xiamenensis]|uniref:MarR family transcriptional regulator n=1 Tax=Thalassospira xiamenensis TaxID=220697 RepID=A0ABR5Y6U2_9PROT|nr:MarR family transcriptional regulator [Thalassospira xiamenensis]KZD07594.1 MarR family transcriptional regulator [Thalassospira xiamenensis]